jgi:hypothetical protein
MTMAGGARRKIPQALHLGSAEGAGFADDRRTGLDLVNLAADGEVAGEQAEADGDLVGCRRVLTRWSRPVPLCSSSIACSARQQRR